MIQSSSELESSETYCLDFDQWHDSLLAKLVAAGRVVRRPVIAFQASHHSSIVAVGRDGVLGVLLVGVLDHAKQALSLLRTIDVPGRVENVVTAMLTVDLCEHEELHVTRGTSKLLVLGDEVFQVGLIETESILLVVVLEDGQRLLALSENIDDYELSSVALGEYGRGGRGVEANVLRHAIVDGVSEGCDVLDALELVLALRFDAQDAAPLDPSHLSLQAADVGNAGSFRAPWRDVPGRDVDVEYVRLVAGDYARLLASGYAEQSLDSIEAVAGLFLGLDVVNPLTRDGDDVIGGGIGVDSGKKLPLLCLRQARSADNGFVHGEGEENWIEATCATLWM